MHLDFKGEFSDKFITKWTIFVRKKGSKKSRQLHERSLELKIKNLTNFARESFGDRSTGGSLSPIEFLKDRFYSCWRLEA